MNTSIPHRARQIYTINRTGIVANLVVDQSGFTAIDGKSKALSTSLDRLLFHYLRSQSDMILIGANTARNEPYANHQIPIAVLTRSEKLPQPFFTGIPPIILKNLDVELALDLMRSQEVQVILCEGGSTLLHQLLDKNLIDVFFLTINVNAQAESNRFDTNKLSQNLVLVDEWQDQEGNLYQRFEGRITK